jgi:double-strand break repair protein MRE11
MQTDIKINPVLIEKGETKLAIFGLGAIKDERLHSLFEKGQVIVNRPTESTDDWFNIFVIHQNRVVHGKKNYIPETFLEGFLDLVIWGHEHECRIKPEFNELKEFYVTQPGSTVITALCESEAVKKSVGILKIHKKNFKLHKTELKTTRPFLMDGISLKSYNLSKTDKNLETKIEKICATKVITTTF